VWGSSLRDATRTENLRYETVSVAYPKDTLIVHGGTGAEQPNFSYPELALFTVVEVPVLSFSW
jgi:hypothetical protein